MRAFKMFLVFGAITCLGYSVIALVRQANAEARQKTINAIFTK